MDQTVIETLIEKIVVHTEKNDIGYQTGATIDIYYPKVNDILGAFLNETTVNQ